MHHSKVENLTFYMVVASEDEEWFPSLLERISVVKGELMASRASLSALSSSPFMLHAVVSTIAFEQSIGYVASVRDRLMEQVTRLRGA